MDITYYFIFKWDLPSLINMTSAEKIEFRKVSTKGIPILSQSLSSHPARCIPTVGFEDIVVVTPGWAKPGQAGREAIIIETRARWCYTRRRFNSSVNQFCPISLSPSLSRYSLCAFLCQRKKKPGVESTSRWAYRQDGDLGDQELLTASLSSFGPSSGCR